MGHGVVGVGIAQDDDSLAWIISWAQKLCLRAGKLYAQMWEVMWKCEEDMDDFGGWGGRVILIMRSQSGRKMGTEVFAGWVSKGVKVR